MKKFLVILVLFVLSLSVSSNAEAKRKKVLFIGDSRTVGMAVSCPSYAKNYYFLAEGGASVKFIDKNLNVRYGLDFMGRKNSKACFNNLTNNKVGSKINLLSALKKKKIKTIIYNLGINGLTGNGYNKYALSTLKKLAKRSGCKVYYMTILPIDNNKYSGYKQSTVNKVNNYFRKNYKYIIDGYNIVIGIRNWRSGTSDGLHYWTSVYSKVLKYATASAKSKG